MLNSPTGTTMSVELINPERATQILESAAPNRNSRQGKIDAYARDMAAGHWHSSVLRFDREGKLVDGQHRLWAVVASDTAQTFFIERGLTEEAIRTIDTGVPRKAADVLTMQGEINASRLASAIRLARWFDLFPGLAPTGQSKFHFTHDEIIDYLDNHPGLRESTAMADTLRKNIPLRRAGVMAAVHHLASRRDAAKAESFFEQMITGVGMVENTGPHALRALILRAEIKQERIDENMLSALTIKAWNAWEYDREIFRLRWGRVGGEIFPRIGGPVVA